jgi:transposase-like protein
MVPSRQACRLSLGPFTGKWPATVGPVRARPVQLRHETALTSEQYVSQEGWRQASLAQCPLHPRGSCGFARHTTYTRKSPPGMRVARWYCPKGRTTFSLLPDCLASRLSGSLDEVEQVVTTVARRKAEGASLEQIAGELRPELMDLRSALRWVKRRVRAVEVALLALVTLLPGRLGDDPSVLAVRKTLATAQALVRLRAIGAAHLGSLAPPLGFGPRPKRRVRRRRAAQQGMGPAPPAQSR